MSREQLEAAVAEMPPAELVNHFASPGFCVEESEPMPGPVRRRWPGWLPGLVSVCVLGPPAAVAGAGWYALADWVPDRTTTRLHGATRDEVRELLGEPEVSSDPDRWVYRRPFRVGEFRVDFDSAGRVEDWSYDR